MRIISGLAKGRRLSGPRGLETRPLTDRAKEALFSSLGSVVADARVLDLYAGSGSLGLEALSRGAASAVFVEKSRRAVVTLEANLEIVGLGGEVRRDDVIAYLSGASGRYDLVFVDPPYPLDEASVAGVMSAMDRVMAPGAVAVVHRRFGGTPPVVPEGLHLVDRRRYGDAELWRFVKEDT